MSPIVLLGDSVFDNAAYVEADEPDVARQLSSHLPSGDEVTLLAVDGHLTSNVSSQIERLPDSATHLFLSVGGNDALQYLSASERFETKPDRFSKAIEKLREIEEDFRQSYRPVVRELLGTGLPTILCTIYNGNFQEASLQSLGRHDSASDQRCDHRDGHRERPPADRPRPGFGRARSQLRQSDRAFHSRWGEDCGAVTEVLESREFASPRAEIYV